MGDQGGTPTVELDGPLAPAASAVRDEALLADARPSVRVTVLHGQALSVGVAVPDGSPLFGRAGAAGIPVVHRRSGGTGVLHESGDLTWAIVLPRTDARLGRDFVRAYARLGAGATGLLDALGLSARWEPAPRLATDCCPLGDRGEVLSAGGRIVGGAAQHLTAQALLHHGFLSVQIDRPVLDALFALPTPGPSVRLGSLRELGVRLPSAEIAARLARAIVDALGSTRTPA